MFDQALQIAVLGAGLGVAAAYDVAQRRIPNLVVAPLAAAGLATQWATDGWPALATGALAGGATLLLLILPWAGGGLGGGDVKLAAAVATWLGTSRLLGFILFTAVAGAPVALAALAVQRRKAREAVRRLGGTALPLEPLEKPRRTVPMAVAIAMGTFAALRWSLP